ncbi:type VI secretion system membrane subunit TssM [Burkholderia sp. IDO3]|uniref:type VI secretion system membrane subunit TssM n=1 Tax=Burkholderia sp. IDO3 TaxID=1705310 RepID=UPI000BBA82B9|nr:type VI secretion system membrane subunit TssM [Burkholderia sp. IDO3]AXK61806.1 type VI secretion system membrane subunit TssM [Burkholderia sp. IDO3]PCD62945.1 type VI secretion system membrane subunit TssM [Burkholderia sp. IDO3]
MQYLNRLLKMVRSRQMLIFAMAIVAVATIWLAGPLVAFDDYRPFETVAARALATVLVLATLLFGLFGWPYGFLIVALVCAVVWCFGPSLKFGTAYPLAPSWARILAISILLAGCAIYGLHRLWKALRRDSAWLQRVLNPSSKEQDVGSRSCDDMRAIESSMARAIEKLKRIRGKKAGLGRLLESQRYLYELPWYMVMGSTGAGKTALILNSGLDFPEAEQMIAAARKRRVGTANCDWWFTNKAVLIDTAGRYTVQHALPQGEGAAADASARDNAVEWRGFLEQLRKRRARAPVNGVLLAVSVETLLTLSPSEREMFAASMRARLHELHGDLGIRFPIYLMVTKLDLLPGFCEYFDFLTTQEREQVFGFTLPYRDRDPQYGYDTLHLDCAAELRELGRRIEGGIDARLLQILELERRKKLYALPSEFRSLCDALTELISRVFLESTYDDTRLHGMLRGVYFTSAVQGDARVPADVTTVMQRLRRGLAGVVGGDAPEDMPVRPGRVEPAGYRSYFLNDLFRHVVVTEGHLVRGNRRWEMRFRALRFGMHLSLILVAAWLALSFSRSFENNREYLDTVGRKSEALASRIASGDRKMPLGAMAPVLSAARDLPKFDGLDLDDPGLAWRYGMYTGASVRGAADGTYARLLNRMLLPELTARMGSVLGAQIEARNADDVYGTLSVYLMLGDRSRYDTEAIKAWVMNDWERGKVAASPVELDIMVGHLDALLAQGASAAPAGTLDMHLVQRARDFLGRVPASGRLYERAIASMAGQAPENVTLSRAAGPQAPWVFALADGSAFERGIPGLYTSEGYRGVFDKLLPEFLDRTRKQDAWVMGRAGGPLERTLSSASVGASVAGSDTLADEIRRRYLIDYGNYWTRFVDDIRLVMGGDDPSSLDMQTLRMLVESDSPLVRLVRTVVHETSLSMSDGAQQASLADATVKHVAGGGTRVARAVEAAGKALDAGRPSRKKMERELVDDRFAALRDISNGGGSRAPDGEPAIPHAAAGVGEMPRLDGIIGLVGREYMRLSMINDALASGSMPAADSLRSAMQFEAETLPAPLRAVLGSIAARSGERVERGVRSLLTSQIDVGVGALCRSAIEGKYPFADSAQEVEMDDFNRLFAAGGVFDEFFRKALAHRVDTDVRPWRYKPTVPGMASIREPDLEPFEQAAAIRQTFFRDPGAARMSWKLGLKVVSMDPEITDLLIDIDGQSMRYAHGPVTTVPITWPGPRGGSMAGLTANPRVRPDTSTIVTEGPWALFRLIDRARVTSTSSSSRGVADFIFDGRHASLELTSGSYAGLQPLDLMRRFRCPGSGSARGAEAVALLRSNEAR